MNKRVKHNTESIKNIDRRTFLTLGVMGVGTFMLGKLVGPYIDAFIHREDKIIDRKDFKNFSLVETNNEMFLTDAEGNDIVIIDKESFR